MKDNVCPITKKDDCAGAEMCKYWFVDVKKHSFCRYKEMNAFRKLAESGKE